MKKSKVAPTPKIKKIKAPEVTAPIVELVSYSIKMVIPTGQYANIQPEIIVKSTSVEEAHRFIAPHMNKLWKEYYLVNERRQEQAPIPTPVVPKYVPLPTTDNPNPNINPCVTSTSTAAPMTISEIAKSVSGTVLGEMPADAPVNEVQPPDSGVAFIKATQAINSCFSLDALALIQAQVFKSVKLSDKDKEALMPLIHEKSLTLFDENEK